METSKRHADASVQREFERIKSNKTAGVLVSQGSGSTAGAVSSKGTQATTPPLRVQYNTLTVVPNTRVVNFIDTSTVTWSITRAGTVAEVRANADGILPDGSLDQTLRNTGDFPKDWVPSSRLMTRLDSAQSAYSDVQGTVEAKGLAGDEVPTMYVKNLNTANDVAAYGQKSGTAIFAVSSAASGTASFSMTIDSINTANNGIAVHGTSNNGIGVKGVSNVGYGTFGISDSAPGAYGESNTGIGVYAISSSNTAVYALTTSGDKAVNAVNSNSTGSGIYTIAADFGVHATSTAASGVGVHATVTNADGTAVVGIADVTDGTGIYGQNNTGTGGVGVLGVANGTGGIGGNFSGTAIGITATGTIAIDAWGDGLHVNGNLVVTDRQAAVADATGTLASVTAQLNDLLAKLRTHGLIAT